MGTSIFLLALMSSLGAIFGQNVDLRFYGRKLTDYQEVPIDSAKDIIASPWYDPKKATVFFAHGYQGNPEGPAVTAVVKTYLDDGQNVVLVNWTELAAQRGPSLAGSYLNWAVPNCKKVGVKFAEIFPSMLEAGLRLENTHLVGHSLGAQLFGIAGWNLMKQGLVLPWITGLDPASVTFEESPPAQCLSRKSAQYVEIIHSDPSRYGYRRPHGTVDFWPNYNQIIRSIRQPGCPADRSIMFSASDLCSHNRSWQYLVDAIKQPGSLLGSFAKNYRVWKNLSQSQRVENTLAIGKLPNEKVEGDYYFTTNDAAPFGRGINGLQPA